MRFSMTADRACCESNCAYGPRGERMIHQLVRSSRPGRREYRKVKDLPRPLAGLGIAVVSTSRGVLSDRQAREQHVGGELLCTVE